MPDLDARQGPVREADIQLRHLPEAHALGECRDVLLEQSIRLEGQQVLDHAIDR